MIGDIARRVLAAAALAMAGAACVADQAPPPPAPPWESALERAAPLTGQIRDLRANEVLSPAALIQRLAQADFVLLGERHDNPDHHRLQAWIVDRLLARGRPYAVAFEMIDGDQADRLSAFLASSPRDAEGLGAALDWDNSGWPAWSYYRPIAAAALARGMPILAANLPASVARTMAKGGEIVLAPGLFERLQLDRPAQRPADRAILAAHIADIQAAHCGLLPERALAPFALTQYARDAHMARAMTDHRPAGGGVILIAGAGHVRTERGVPHHLARFANGARMVALAFVETEEVEVGAPAAASPPTDLPYDIAWFTARIESNDGCNKMREKMGLPKNTKGKN